GALIGVAFVFLYTDALGRELVPSEDQSRFVIHVVCPVGSSIDNVDFLLRQCEEMLDDRHELNADGPRDIRSFLTNVATEPGQLINEADIFVQLVPQHSRVRTQTEIMREVREDLRKIRGIQTIIVRDQSTEGFTAQQGDPIDFAIQGDWSQLPGKARQVMDA